MNVTSTMDYMESIDLRVALQATIEETEARHQRCIDWAREAATDSNHHDYKMWARAANNCKAATDILKRVMDAAGEQLCCG